jgi:hypothetical protein
MAGVAGASISAPGPTIKCNTYYNVGMSGWSAEKIKLLKGIQRLYFANLKYT